MLYPRITASIFVSFAARGLSSIRSQIFCYTAISSSSIICILPGYLIRTFLQIDRWLISDRPLVSSSLELASKNIVCGSVKMVYALIYTLFLVCALGLHIVHRPIMKFLGLWTADWLRFLSSVGSSHTPQPGRTC